MVEFGILPIIIKIIYSRCTSLPKTLDEVDKKEAEKEKTFFHGRIWDTY